VPSWGCVSKRTRPLSSRAFIDDHQSETAAASRTCEIEAPSIVDDRRLHPFCRLHDARQRASPRCGLLLSNPVEARRHVGPDARDVAAGAVCHINPLPVLKLCAERTQCGIQIRVLEQNWVWWDWR